MKLRNNHNFAPIAFINPIISNNFIIHTLLTKNHDFVNKKYNIAQSYNLKTQYDYVRSFAGDTSTQTITKDAINNLPFPLCSVTEQNRIVAKVDELMSICDQLKTRITKANQIQQKLADVMVEQALAA